MPYHFRMIDTMTGWLERPPGYHLQKFEKDHEVKAAVDSMIRRALTIKEVVADLKEKFGERAPSASALQRYIQKWRKLKPR